MLCPRLPRQLLNGELEHHTGTGMLMGMSRQQMLCQSLLLQLTVWPLAGTTQLLCSMNLAWLG